MNNEIAILRSERNKLCSYIKHKLDNVSYDTNIDKEVAELNEINEKIKKLYKLD